MLISDAYKSQLVQTGPPPGANNPIRFRPMSAETLAELRSIQIAASDWQTPDGKKIPTVVLLLGEDAPYDGNLQGFYLAYRPDRVNYPEDGGAVVYSTIGDICWRKIT